MGRQELGVHDPEIEHGEVVEPPAELPLIIEEPQRHLVIQGFGKFGGELAGLLLRIDPGGRPRRGAEGQAGRCGDGRSAPPKEQEYDEEAEKHGRLPHGNRSGKNLSIGRRLLKNVARKAGCKAHGAQNPRHIRKDRRGGEHRATPQAASAVVFQEPVRQPGRPRRKSRCRPCRRNSARRSQSLRPRSMAGSRASSAAREPGGETQPEGQIEIAVGQGAVPGDTELVAAHEASEGLRIEAVEQERSGNGPIGRGRADPAKTVRAAGW